MAAQDVGRLAERQTEISPVERDVGEADERPAGRLLRPLPFDVGLDPRQRDARLHAPLHVDERDLHVDGRCELRMHLFELLQLDDLARLRPRRAGRSIRRAGRSIRHEAF